jgi:hypothetical protein
VQINGELTRYLLLDHALHRESLLVRLETQVSSTLEYQTILDSVQQVISVLYSMGLRVERRSYSRQLLRCQYQQVSVVPIVVSRILVT